MSEQPEPITSSGQPATEFEAGRLRLAGIPEPDWVHYRVLKNGACYDTRQNKITHNPGGGVKAFTSESAQELRNLYDRRRLEARLHAQEALGRLEIDTEHPSVLAGWQAIVEAQAKLALDTHRGKASTDAARFVASATGFTQVDGHQDAGGGDRVTVSMPASVLAALAQYLRAADTVTVDARVRDP